MDDSILSEITPLNQATPTYVTSPNNQSLKRRRVAVYLILFSTLLERLAFYSLYTSLVENLQTSELKWSVQLSTTASFVFLGISYISSIVFAVFSDGSLGRRRTILTGFVFYLIGYLLLALISHQTTHIHICGNLTNNSTSNNSYGDEHCRFPVFLVLIIIGVGVGAVQTNVAIFGAEQIYETKMVSRYFDKYYLAVNIGATIASCCISLLQKTSHQSSDLNAYFYGYLIGLFILFLAIILYLFGYRYYLPSNSNHDSIILKIIPVIVNAYETRRWYREQKTRKTFDDEGWIIHHEEKLSLLDYADMNNHGKFHENIINDIKSLSRVLIVFFLLIPYGIIYSQMQTTFPSQGQQMSLPLLYNQTSMPVSWMSLGDTITIILSVVILTLFIYKYFDRRNRRMSIRTRFIIGMIFAALSMIMTSIVEVIRQNKCQTGPASSLTIFAQSPQYILMGFGEIFASIGSLEFVYLASPRSATSLFMSLQFCSFGVSSLLSNGYFALYSIGKHSQFDFSCEYCQPALFSVYFLILAVVQILFVFIIYISDKKYGILKLNPRQTQIYAFQTT